MWAFAEMAASENAVKSFSIIILQSELWKKIGGIFAGAKVIFSVKCKNFCDLRYFLDQSIDWFQFPYLTVGLKKTKKNLIRSIYFWWVFWIFERRLLERMDASFDIFLRSEVWDFFVTRGDFMHPGWCKKTIFLQDGRVLSTGLNCMFTNGGAWIVSSTRPPAWETLWQAMDTREQVDDRAGLPG